MELIEIKRGFWLHERDGKTWYLHYGMLGVASAQAENESDALVKMAAELQQKRAEAERSSLRDLYAWAMNWIEDYRQ